MDAGDLVEALPVPVVVIDRQERIALVNDAAENLIGPGLVGRHYVTALRQPAMLDMIESALHRGERGETKFHASRAGSDARWIARAIPIRESILVSFEDRSHLEEAGQMRRDFVANVSHELRTPLTALMGFIETLRHAARDDAAARDRFLATMEHEAGRMNRLISDLLSLSRVEQDERVRPTGRVDIVGILGAVQSSLTPMADNAGAEIAVAPLGAVAGSVVTGDADQLAQVFTNLVENALKYGAKRVTIQVSETPRVSELRGPALIVDVADDGPGIDPLHLPRLTERFYRVDTHRSREVGGTGLGLAIVKHILGRHRGRLRITSVPGAGSRFSVMLPR